MKLKELFDNLANLNKALKLFYGEDEADKKLSLYVDDIHEGKFNNYREIKEYLANEYTGSFYCEMIYNAEFNKVDRETFTATFVLENHKFIINIFLY